MLTGRKLRVTLLHAKRPQDHATEAEWQVLLRERYACTKLREKEYADSNRHAATSDIEEGDGVLLRQNRENKLPPTFQPDQYRVVEKNGSGVIIESSTGQSKMRNVDHLKRFVGRETESQTPVTDVPTHSESRVPRIMCGWKLTEILWTLSPNPESVQKEVENCPELESEKLHSG